jgi:outer membrane protein assembly factor BamB
MLFFPKVNNRNCGKMTVTSVQNCDDGKSDNSTAIKHEGCRNQILAKRNARFRNELVAVIGIALLAGGIARSSRAGSDFLYIGDGQDTIDTVKRFDANSGKYLGIFIQPTTNQGFFLDGPRGLIFNHQGHLLVANQNEHQSYAGEIFEYGFNGQTAVFLKALVPHSNPNAPSAPRGIVLSDQYLFVASQTGDFPNGNGLVRAYDPTTGEMHQALPVPSEFASGNFHPDGVVIYGGLLYVANRHVPGGGGEILRYRLDSLAFQDVFIRSDIENDLNAPKV